MTKMKIEFCNFVFVGNKERVSESYLMVDSLNES